MAIDKPYKIGNLAYTLARQLLVKDKGGIASLPSPEQILGKVQDIFQMLKAGGFNPVSAEKSIKNVNDLKKVLTDIEMKQQVEFNLAKSKSEGLETVLEKMDKGIPLNPGDQAKMSGIEKIADDEVLDAFKGFTPKVIQGGKGAETEAEMIARMNKQNKDSVARLKQKKEKDLGDKLNDYDGDPDAMAIGGRAGFKKGDIVTKGIPFLIKELKKRFGKKAITTADKIDSPAKTKLNKEFKDFEERIGNRRLTEDELEDFAEEIGDNIEAYDLPQTVGERNKILKDIEDYKKYMFQEYKAGRLDPKRGEPGRREFLEKKLQEAEMSGDSRLIDPDELDELTDIEFKERTMNAQGGRIGFSGGGAGFAGDPMEGDQYTMGQQIPGSPQVPMGEFGPVNVGIFGGGGYSKNQIVPGVDMATTNQNYGITGQIPIGNTGFTIGGDYMKSRANERFTGDAIPGQTFKSVPTDSDRFNVGINYTKTFKDGGRIGFKEGTPKNPGRRNFMKLMAGLASLPVVGKLFKGAKVADKVVQLKNTTTTMPAWFPKFVDRFISKGVGKKVDQDLMEFENPEVPGIKLTKHDDGRVFVEGQNDYSKSYEIEYTPPGYQVVDEKTGKAVKTKGDFMAQEEVPVNVDPDGNADFDGEILESVDDILSSDARAMEEFATGKKVKEMKRGEYNVGQAEARAEQAADEAAELSDEFSQGGLAYMLGE